MQSADATCLAFNPRSMDEKDPRDMTIDELEASMQVLIDGMNKILDIADARVDKERAAKINSAKEIL